MSIYPTVRPSLTLDFQKSKQLDPRISFSRSSSATYVEGGVIKYADEHQARFEEEGLLIEESRTNLFPYSEDFSDVSWTKSNTTVTTNSTSAPDNTNTADKLVTTNTNSSHYVVSVKAVTAANHTVTLFSKSAEKEWLTINIFNGSTYLKYSFNVSTGQLGISAAGGTSAITQLANGWYKCTVSYTSTVTGNNSIHFHIYDDSSTENFQGDGTSGLYVWGAQLEQGSFPTSYIPTSGSTVNRAADVCTITGDNFNSWYNQSEGTFAFEYNAPNQLLDNALGVWGAKSTNNAARLEFYTGNSSSGAATFDTSTGRSFQFLTRAQAVSGKYALAIKKDSFALSQNGNAALTDNSGDMNSTNQMVVLALGTTNNVNNQLYGHISRFTFYPRRLTDLELETLTL